MVGLWNVWIVVVGKKLGMLVDLEEKVFGKYGKGFWIMRVFLGVSVKKNCVKCLFIYKRDNSLF